MKRFAIAAISLLSVTLPAFAADKMATLDPKVPCSIEYPKASLMNEEKGTVVLGLKLSAEGKVLESKVNKSSGFKNLDKAAEKSITKCKFVSPGGDQWQTLEYVWKLD
ncbi:TonB family protein [Pseudoduganella sp. FT93W]|uniref:TonB family protein n=1 Tax=Duganella fentianensis TaxID=2692177 RepID=A0A845I148_9BURK|nr:TonB family protein [Duganella fentianensis]MYN44438.1 TonB family protein [Duganella fentianensis]